MHLGCDPVSDVCDLDLLYLVFEEEDEEVLDEVIEAAFGATVALVFVLAEDGEGMGGRSLVPLAGTTVSAVVVLLLSVVGKSAGGRGRWWEWSGFGFFECLLFGMISEASSELYEVTEAVSVVITT